MNKILEQIIAKKREDLREKKKLSSLQDLKGQVKKNKGSGLFYKAVNEGVNDPAVIAEVKFDSPSKPHPYPLLKGEGNKLRIFDISKDLLKRVKEYEASGADAISIITEQHFFKGSVDFIGKVEEAVKLPILQKDFVMDEYQIYEAKKAGADALLLIARLVDNKTLEQFVELCIAEGIEPLVEVYSEEDLEKAAGTETRFIAVNSRDLDTFEVDVERACRLMKKIPENFVRLGFSGIQSAEEVIKYREAGARGVLVGTSLMKARNIGEFLKEIMIQKGKDQSAKIKYQIQIKNLKCS